MEETSVPTEHGHRRRRRSNQKSSKESYQRRKRWKSLGQWFIFALIGAVAVAAIAVLAGSASN